VIVAFLAASRIARFLGITGNIVLSRALSVFLAAFATQSLIEGLKAAL
jgi:multiple antibiotic resistance protein